MADLLENGVWTTAIYIQYFKRGRFFGGARPLMTTFFCPKWRLLVRPGMTGLAQIRGAMTSSGVRNLDMICFIFGVRLFG